MRVKWAHPEHPRIRERGEGRQQIQKRNVFLRTNVPYPVVQVAELVRRAFGPERIDGRKKIRASGQAAGASLLEEFTKLTVCLALIKRTWVTEIPLHVPDVAFG